MYSLAALIVGIRTYHALTSMQRSKLTTRLSVTLGISIIALVGARLSPFGISVPVRIRISWVLVPLHYHGPVMDSKRTPASALPRLIWGPTILAFSTSLPPMTLLHLFCMYHQPSKVHVIMQHGWPTFFSRSFDTPVTILFMSSLLMDTKEEAFGKVNNLQGVFLDWHTSLMWWTPQPYPLSSLWE